MKNGLYILISIMVIITSCKSVSYLPVDLTLPASQPLPENVQSLTLVDRSVDLRYTNIPSDSIQLNFLRARFNLDSMMYDKAASDTLVQVLGKLLFESGRFDVVIPEERFLENNTLHLYSEPMDWNKVTALTNLYRTDAVLAVDYFNTMVHTEFGREMIYNAVDQVNYMINKAAMKIDYTTLYRLYNPYDSAKTLSFFVTDTLYWEDADFDIKRLFRRFPSVKQGLHEAGIASALKLSGRIAPDWEPSNRVFFSKGNEILENTAIMVFNNEWDKALETWLSNYEKTDSKSLRSKLEFNIALGYEMQGDLDEAIEWGLKSYQTQYRTLTFSYLEELKKRKTLLTVPNENN